MGFTKYARAVADEKGGIDGADETSERKTDEAHAANGRGGEEEE